MDEGFPRQEFTPSALRSALSEGTVMNRAAILSFSERGGALAERLADGLRGDWQVEQRAPRGDLAAVAAELFPAVDALIFVGACGIAVRAVAPLLVGKTRDPAVVVVDERGRHAISLLSGHIGGANALALRVAGITGGEAVITTATDVNGRFSVDAWAARHGLRISDMRLAKRFSAEILRRDLPLWSEFPIEGKLPAGIFLAERAVAARREDTAVSRAEANLEQRGAGTRRMEARASQPTSREMRQAAGARPGEISRAHNGLLSVDELLLAERAVAARREDTAESRTEANLEQRGAGTRRMEARESQPTSREMRQAAGARPGEISGAGNGLLFVDERARAQEAAPSGDIAEQAAGDALRAEKDSAPRTGASLGHRGDIGTVVVEGQSTPQAREHLNGEAEQVGEACRAGDLGTPRARERLNGEAEQTCEACRAGEPEIPQTREHLNGEAEQAGEAYWAGDLGTPRARERLNGEAEQTCEACRAEDPKLPRAREHLNGEAEQVGEACRAGESELPRVKEHLNGEVKQAGEACRAEDPELPRARGRLNGEAEQVGEACRAGEPETLQVRGCLNGEAEQTGEACRRGDPELPRARGHLNGEAEQAGEAYRAEDPELPRARERLNGEAEQAGEACRAGEPETPQVREHLNGEAEQAGEACRAGDPELPRARGHLNGEAEQVGEACRAGEPETLQVRGRLNGEAEQAGEACRRGDPELPRARGHLNGEAEQACEAYRAGEPETSAGANPGSGSDIGAAITCRAERPFDKTLRLIPPVLHLGIGCKRGASAEQIADAVRAALDEAGLLPEAVADAASIDVKRDEPGLQVFCASVGIPIAFYSAEELRAQPGEFTASEFVERTVGVDNVCERAAMRAAGLGAKLLVPKRGANGVTVAIAYADWRVRFP